jgi:hypothetical protein
MQTRTKEQNKNEAVLRFFETSLQRSLRTHRLHGSYGLELLTTIILASTTRVLKS